MNCDTQILISLHLNFLNIEILYIIRIHMHTYLCSLICVSHITANDNVFIGQAQTDIQAHVYMHAHIHICTHKHTHTHRHTHTYTLRHTDTHTHRHVHKHRLRHRHRHTIYHASGFGHCWFNHQVGGKFWAIQEWATVIVRGCRWRTNN